MAYKGNNYCPSFSDVALTGTKKITIKNIKFSSNSGNTVGDIFKLAKSTSSTLKITAYSIVGSENSTSIGNSQSSGSINASVLEGSWIQLLWTDRAIQSTSATSIESVDVTFSSIALSGYTGINLPYFPILDVFEDTQLSNKKYTSYVGVLIFIPKGLSDDISSLNIKFKI